MCFFVIQSLHVYMIIIVFVRVVVVVLMRQIVMSSQCDCLVFIVFV